MRTAKKEYPLTILSLSDLAETLARFGCEHFAGLLEVKRNFTDTELLRISPEGFAYLLKRILKEINGKATLNLSITLSFPYVVIKLSSNGMPPISESLLHLAEQSGFSTLAGECGEFVLTAKTIKNPSLFVYAASTDELLCRILDAFYA